MVGARLIFYTHCLVAIACVALTIMVLDRMAHQDWAFRGQFERFFAHPVTVAGYLLCAASCFVFPAALAWRVVLRTSASRWVPLMAADIVLSLVQFVALMVVVPVRT
jgi:hypothetical protein